MIFEGLKVIDCGSFIAAPAAATMLSDFGADVIKIEPPGGDTFRNLSKLPGHPKSDHNYPWMIGSRNKRSLEIDLGKPEARAVIEKLVKGADIFITNYPMGVRKKLGITYEALVGDQRQADLWFVHGLWRQWRGSQQARLRRHGLLGALGPDGYGARLGAGCAGPPRQRHGRLSVRPHALFRHRHGALPAPQDRQGR